MVYKIRLSEKGLIRNGNIDYVSNCYKIIFVTSTTAMTTLLSLRGSLFNILVGIACSFLLILFITFKFDLLEKVLAEKLNKIQLAAATLCALVACYEFLVSFYIKFLLSENAGAFLQIGPLHQFLNKCLILAIGAIALPAIIFFLYLFISRFGNFCLDWFRQIDKTEKYYLLICWLIFSISIIVIFNLTNVFYGATNAGSIIDYDVVYTSDSATILSTNVFLQVNAAENDIRQPLFGLFAMPFAIVATILAKLLFFMPNAYPIIISIIQAFLLLISLVSITRMLHLRSLDKLFFLIILTVSYPTMLFALNIEQYIFTLFWLILTLYAYTERKQLKEYLFIAATGSMVTSGVFSLC